MRKLKSREKRLLVYFGLLIAFLVGDKIYRYWTYSTTKETEHYIIYSSATREQTDEIASVAEILYQGYQEFLGQLGKSIQSHPKLKMKLYKNREEFRRCNRGIGWAEAFYRHPYCCLYYDADGLNPYHWMMHEATHQLNAEAACFALQQWLDEGTACYISTSKIVDKSLHLGDVDVNTYPVWWLANLAMSGDMETDKKNGSVIPLRAIISGKGGPDINKEFNLYYLHWWSLVHFLMNYGDGQYREGLNKVITEHGTISSFEENIGKIEDIETQWYQYVIELKRKYL